MKPSHASIVEEMRKFVGSILGPYGDGKRPDNLDGLDYDFFGHKDLNLRFNKFSNRILKMMTDCSSHEGFEEVDDDAVSAMSYKYTTHAMDYVMKKVEHVAMEGCKIFVKRAHVLFNQKRESLLQTYGDGLLEYLEVGSSKFISKASSGVVALKKINDRGGSPRYKISCVRECCDIILTSTTAKDEGEKEGGENESKPIGADDLMPMLIYIITTSPPPNLLANLNYIESYSTRELLIGETGYCLCAVSSAVEWIKSWKA